MQEPKRRSEMHAAGGDTLDLEHFLPYRLSVLSNTVSSAIAQAYATRFALTVPEWRVMAVVARYPGLSAVEVAERTAMDKVAVSRAVQSLLGSRRLTRRFDARDRRRSMLHLSSTGQSVYGRVAPVALGYERDLLSVLTAAEQSTLDTLLSRLMNRARDLARPDFS